MVMALCWLSLRLMDVVAELSLKRLQRVHRSGDTALVRLINRLLKAATVIVAGLVLLYLSDVDLTAALTGLGVGGLAIGFGAQKTIENLFGGIMVISDKPVNVGDVCRVGEFFGTVEDIGIRSTRIRTLDRTVVSVPNGQLAAMSLENFAMRDRIRFHHTVGLARQTTADQLRSVLAEIRRLLDAHPKVESTSARTRFIRFSGSSLDLEIFAYVLETDQAAFLAIQEELLLGAVTLSATMRLFLKPDRIGASVHMRTNVSHCGGSGIQTGGRANTCTLVFSAVVNIQSSGASIASEPTASRTNRATLPRRLSRWAPVRGLSFRRRGGRLHQGRGHGSSLRLLLSRC